MVMTLAERLQLIYAGLTGHKTALVQQLTNKNVAANSGETFASLINKINTVSTGTDYRLYIGPWFSTSSGTVSSNAGAKAIKTKSFTLPFPVSGMSAGNVILLSGIGQLEYTGGSSGVTSNSVELTQLLPFWTYDMSQNYLPASFASIKSMISANGSYSQYPVGGSGASLTFAPTTGTFSTAHAIFTYTAAIPGNSNTGSASSPSYILGNDKRQPYRNVNMAGAGTFELTFFTGNATYDYECGSARVYSPLYAIKVV
jgi:hypothetical protein